MSSQQLHAALADLAIFALRARDRDEVFQEVSRRIAHALAVEQCGVFELQPVTLDLTLCAGVGWNDGAVSRAIESGPMTSADVVVLELPVPALLAEHRVAAGACAVIRRGEKVFGVLGSYTTAARTFAGEELECVRVAADLLAAWLERHEGDDERLRAADAANRDAERQRDEFLATLAHEMRTPLAAMLAALGVIRQMAPATAALQRAIAVSERQTTHLRRLVDDVFDIGRVRRGAIVLQTRPVDLAQAVEATLESYGLLAEPSERRFTMAFPPELLLVEADPTRLQQIIGNLLDNAIKYTARGGLIEIHGEVDGRYAALRVRDDGIGIAPDVLPRVFDMFRQADSLRARSAGLGIGLALVRSLAHLHGGSVTATSDGMGHGAEFTVRLPLAARERRTDTEPAPPKRCILLVEDDRESRELLRVLLEAAGHSLCVARDRDDALDAARTRGCEVAIVGLGAPGVDGFAIATGLRDSVKPRALRLIAITDPGVVSTPRETGEPGFDAFIERPVDPEELAVTLARLGAESESAQSTDLEGA